MEIPRVGVLVQEIYCIGKRTFSLQMPAPKATVETEQEPEVPPTPTSQVPAQEEQSPTPPKPAQLLPTAPPPETPKEKPQQPIIRELAF